MVVVAAAAAAIVVYSTASLHNRTLSHAEPSAFVRYRQEEFAHAQFFSRSASLRTLFILIFSFLASSSSFFPFPVFCFLDISALVCRPPLFVSSSFCIFPSQSGHIGCQVGRHSTVDPKDRLPPNPPSEEEVEAKKVWGCVCISVSVCCVYVCAYRNEPLCP